MCRIRPAVNSLAFENRLTQMSRDKRAASVDAATVGIDRSRSGDRPGTVAISSLHVVSKSPEGTPKRA
jgi:hypothetical protein